MFRNYEGYSRSGYGSQSDCYDFKTFHNGQLVFEGRGETLGKILRATKEEFIRGLDETYINAYHRYQLAAGEDRDAIINFINSL